MSLAVSAATAATLASATTTTVTTTSPATAAAATATAAATVFPGTSFVDGQVAAIMLLLVQRRDCLAGRIVVGHFDKAEALAPASVPVGNDLGAPNRTVLSKQFFQARVRDVVTQIPNIQLHSHR